MLFVYTLVKSYSYNNGYVESFTIDISLSGTQQRIFVHGPWPSVELTLVFFLDQEMWCKSGPARVYG